MRNRVGGAGSPSRVAFLRFWPHFPRAIHLCYHMRSQSASFTFDAPAAGILAKVHVPENGEAKGKDKLATLVTSKDQLEAFTAKVFAMIRDVWKDWDENRWIWRG